MWADLASVLLEKKYYDFHHGLSLNEEDEHKKNFINFIKNRGKNGRSWMRICRM